MAEELIEKAGGIAPVASRLESRSMIRLCNDLLKSAEKYQKDNNREALWKRLDQKLHGKYYVAGESKKRKVETIASYVYNTINAVAPRRPYIRITAKTPKYTMNGQDIDNVRNAYYREGAVNQEFDEVKIHKQVKKSMRAAYCPYGYGLTKIGYGVNTSFDERGQEKIESEGFWAKYHPSSDFFAGVFSTDQDFMPYALWRFWVPMKKALQKEQWNQDILRDMAGDTIPTFLYSDQKKDYGANIKIAEVFELHHIEEDWIATFTRNGSDFLEMPHDNPYTFKGIHGAIYAPWPLNDEFYPRSQAELVEDQADDINESREHVRRHVKAFGQFVMDYSGDPAQNDFDFKYTPYGGKVNVKNGKKGDFEVFTSPQLNRDVYMWGDQAREDAQWVLAKSDMSHGQVDPKEKLGQTNIVAGRENANVMAMQEDVGDFYETLADKCGDLLVQYTTGEKWFKYRGEIRPKVDPMNPMQTNERGDPFESYTVSDIVGSFDHKAEIETMSPTNNEVRATVMLNGLRDLPNMGKVGEEIVQKYDLTQIYVKAYKLQNCDLDEFKKPEEENAKENDPYQENEHALNGGLLGPALPGEGPTHLPVHIAVAMATKNDEIARHVLDHQGVEANNPQGVAQAQAMQAGQVQGGPQMPIQQGAQQSGGAPMPGQPGQMMQAIKQQMRPM